METIHILFFKQKDLLLFDKTGFRKNLMFQLLLFFITVFEIILTLMSLKLLQVEQSKLINRLPGKRSIVFNGENSFNSVFNEISKGKYIYIFINLEITISKKFKKYIFDHFFFIN